MKILILALLNVFLTYDVNSQNIKTDSIRNKAVLLYQHSDFINAEDEFKKIIEIDPDNLDALYNLGVINSQLGKQKESVNYFQKCVKLRDRESAKILKEDYKVPIEYSDFMHADDVDELPQFLYKTKYYKIVDKGALNNTFLSVLQKELKKSELVRKSKFSGKVFLQLEIDKRGKLICIIQKGTQNLNLDNGIKTILENTFEFIPGKYQGLDVGVWAWVLPLTI